MKSRDREISVPASSQIGFAWFTPGRWQRFTEVVGCDALDDTFEQWERSALAALYQLRSQGHSVRKVMIDV